MIGVTLLLYVVRVINDARGPDEEQSDVEREPTV